MNDDPKRFYFNFSSNQFSFEAGVLLYAVYPKQSNKKNNTLEGYL